MRKFILIFILLANVFGCSSTKDEELEELSFFCEAYADSYVMANENLKHQSIDRVIERLLLMSEAVNLPEGGDLVIDVMLVATKDAHAGIANYSPGDNLKHKAHNYCLSEYSET